MLKRIIAAIAISALMMGSAFANSEKKFFEQIKGKWQGAGQIVAGKYEGQRFNCSFDGNLPEKLLGMSIDGNCRVGIFSQPMNSAVSKKNGRYKGTFLDGAKGKGLDIISGRFINGRKGFVMNLRRKDLKGAMRAQLIGEDKLNISVSVLVNGKYIPVIGLDLERK